MEDRDIIEALRRIIMVMEKCAEPVSSDGDRKNMPSCTDVETVVDFDKDARDGFTNNAGPDAVSKAIINVLSSVPDHLDVRKQELAGAVNNLLKGSVVTTAILDKSLKTLLDARKIGQLRRGHYCRIPLRAVEVNGMQIRAYPGVARG